MSPTACTPWRQFRCRLKPAPLNKGMSRRTRQGADRLRDRAYHRHQRSSGILEAIDRHLASTRTPRERQDLRTLRGWVAAPPTLWPVNIDLLAEQVLRDLKESGRPSKVTSLLIHLLGRAPSDPHPHLLEHERRSQQGSYQEFFPSSWQKYAAHEAAVRENARLRADWLRIKRLFDVDVFRDPKGIIRRSMLPERNFRPKWPLDLEGAAAFTAVFDTFCARWNLYGMLLDEPLLSKPTVSASPLGTIIFIPRYWALDPNRDLDPVALRRLHHACFGSHQARRTRAKVTEVHEAIQCAELDREARARHLRGGKWLDFMLRGLGWPLETEERKVRRRLELHRRLTKAEPECLFGDGPPRRVRPSRTKQASPA